MRARNVVVRACLAVVVAALPATVVAGTAQAQAAPPPEQLRLLGPIAGDRVDGVGLATLVLGDRVYLGGTFANVRNQAGTVIAPRANLAAFDRATGALVGAFRADTDGAVRTLSTDGTSLFVGGSFTTVNGVARSRIAAVDPATGALRTGFAANANSHVYASTFAGGRLFVSGSFSTIKSVARGRVAALNPVTGAVDPTFDPAANGTVQALAATLDGSKVFLGGAFTNVKGTSITWLTAVSGVTGAVTSPVFQDVSGTALDLQLAPDGSHLAAAIGDGGNQGAWYDIATGAKLWRQRCGGDGQAVATVGATMFTGFHEECESDYTIRLVSNDVNTSIRDLSFKPAFDRFWGVRDLAGDSRGLVVAGDFTNVAGVPLQGIAIFPAAPPPPPPPLYLPRGSTWRYLDTGVAPTPDWTQVGYVDTAWKAGRAELGYGDGDEATIVGFGPNAGAKYLATWFRTTFESTAVPATITLDLLADDGAVVYLNGAEVVRDNVAAGTVTAQTRAAGNRSGTAETALRSFSLPANLVRVGTNVIAVSVHQDVPSSSDISFDAVVRSTAVIPAAAARR